MEVEVAPHPAAAKVVDFEDWACNSNERTEISLVQLQRGDIDSNRPIISTSFNPDFTYSVFNEAETIFGYKNLSIKIKYASGSLKPYVEINYTDKYTPQSSSSIKDEVEADDINAVLDSFLPKERVLSYHQFIDTVKRDYTHFRPLGEKVQEYTKENNDGTLDHFEIYKCTFADKDMRRYYSRLKLFTLLFVEGSSLIDDDDEKWEIYITYKREQLSIDSYTYHFIGYCTAYPFYCWPENVRMRISQFLILPPFKKQGHGSRLYQTICQVARARKDVYDITVEDPNEEFADMRDKNDFRLLKQCNAFEGLKAPVPKEKMKDLQAKYKLTDRMTQRIIEMYLLSKLDKMNPDDYKAYRLQVKKRIFIQNYDVLQDIEEEERKEKLEQTYLSVEDDYHRLLDLI